MHKYASFLQYRQECLVSISFKINLYFISDPETDETSVESLEESVIARIETGTFIIVFFRKWHCFQNDLFCICIARSKLNVIDITLLI